MRRGRFPTTIALLLFTAGMVLTVWAASGVAAVSGAAAQVVLALNSRDVLELSCSEGTGHADGFCQADPSGDYLNLNFDLGLDGLEYGLQPGSRYTFGNVMYIKNVFDESLDVFIRVEQAAGGSLYQVLTVFLEAPGGDKLQMFPPDSGDGTERTVPMAPGDTAGLSFAFDVPEDWGSFEGSDTRYKLEGAVIVRVAVEDDPGGVIVPPGDDEDEEDGTGEESTTEEDDSPLGGPSDEEDQVDEEDAPLEASPALPLTGGSTWPYVLLGLFLMAVGATLYLWAHARDRAALNQE